MEIDETKFVTKNNKFKMRKLYEVIEDRNLRNFLKKLTSVCRHLREFPKLIKFV